MRRFTGLFVPVPGVVSYLDENPLGRPLAAFPERSRSFTVLLLGAGPGQVFVGNSTTVLFYKLIRAAVDHRPDRTEIVIDDDNFPTDRFVVEGITVERGLTIRWMHPDRARLQCPAVHQRHSPDPGRAGAGDDALPDRGGSIEAVRATSVALVRCAHVLPLGAALADERVRGGHLAVARPALRDVTARLRERGVIPDFRSPDGIRLGLSPPSTAFTDVEGGVRAIGEELRSVPFGGNRSPGGTAAPVS